MTKKLFQLQGCILCWHRWLWLHGITPQSEKGKWREPLELLTNLIKTSMDECDSVCPNKQTTQNTAKRTRGLNLGLRFVASQNPNPDLASTQASLNFTSSFSKAWNSQHLHGKFGFLLALRAREWQSRTQRVVCLLQPVSISIDQFGKLNSGCEWPRRPTAPGSIRRCLCPSEYLCQGALKINN